MILELSIITLFIVAEPENPTKRILDDMSLSRDNLQKQKIDEETLKTQKDIIEQLDKLLKPPEQSNNNDKDKNQKQQNPQNVIKMGQVRQVEKLATKKILKPSSSPAKEGGTGKVEKPTQPKVLRDMMGEQTWGHLPAAERERMIQIMKEGFLPEYQNLIREYYESISNEKEQK
jgi:hypothetical protein